jgi:hypothetical protein
MNKRCNFFLFFILTVIAISSKAQVTYEGSMGSTRTGVDVIYATPLDSMNRWRLISRNIASAFYNHSTSLVSFNSLSYSLKSGFGIVVNNLFTSARFYSAIGLQYIFNSKHIFLYLYFTKEISSNNFHDHVILVAWQPKIAKNLKLLFQNELNFTLFGLVNDNSLERLKVGLNYSNRFQFGLIIEAASSEKTFQPNYQNVGFFINKLI